MLRTRKQTNKETETQNRSISYERNKETEAENMN